jgi:hypothetical protein
MKSQAGFVSPWSVFLIPMVIKICNGILWYDWSHPVTSKSTEYPYLNDFSWAFLRVKNSFPIKLFKIQKVKNKHRFLSYYILTIFLISIRVDSMKSRYHPFSYSKKNDDIISRESPIRLLRNRDSDSTIVLWLLKVMQFTVCGKKIKFLK